MRGRLGRRSGAAAAILLATLVAIPASPAAADQVTITAPAAGAVLDSASVVVTGSAEVPPQLLQPVGVPLSTLDSVTISVGDKSVTAANCSGKTSCTYRATFSLPLNGPSVARVVAKTNGLLAGDGSKERTFAVAAPAATPVLDPPKVSPERSVELSWSRNTEPDMLHYELIRTGPGEPVPRTVTVAQPATGTKVTLRDTTTSAFGGGTYTYQVVAVRKGAKGTAEPASRSAASRTVSATVPAPLATSSTTLPNAAGAPAGGPTTTARPAPPAGVDLSGFLSSRSQPIVLPPVTVPQVPDTGFAGSLPFGARPPGEELEEGEPDAVPPGNGPSSSVVSVDAGRPLIPVAGGLVLLLLALHMRLLGRRVKALPDGDLPVDLAHQPPPVPVAADPAPEPEPQTVVYDVMAEAEDDGGWAAVAPEPEQESVAHEPEREPVALAPEPVATLPEPEVEPDPPPVVVQQEPQPVAPPAEPEPEPVALAPEPVALAPDPEPVALAPDREAEPEVVDLWAPPPSDEEPVPEEPDPDEIVVVEVVSSARRRLARVGDR